MFHSMREIAAQRPTGRKRHRTSWRGKMILQIEIESPMPRYPMAPPPPGWPLPDVWATGAYTFWRDARLADAIVNDAGPQ